MADAALVGALIGAAAAIVGGAGTQILTHHLESKTRWRAPLLAKASALAAAARDVNTLAHLLTHASEQPSGTDLTVLESDLNSARRQVRGLVEEVRLLGFRDVQTAARVVQHHVFAVREVGAGRPDPHRDLYPDSSPYQRLDVALEGFARAVRRQLGVPEADEVFVEQRDDAGRTRFGAS